AHHDPVAVLDQVEVGDRLGGLLGDAGLERGAIGHRGSWGPAWAGPASASVPAARRSRTAATAAESAPPASGGGGAPGPPPRGTCATARISRCRSGVAGGSP